MANSFYDALYAWVSVLHSLTVNYPNIEFNYANNFLVEMFTKQFLNSLFGGITGLNSSTGFANHPVNLYQITNGQEVNIGSLNFTTINILPSFSHISDKVKNVNNCTTI